MSNMPPSNESLGAFSSPILDLDRILSGSSIVKFQGKEHKISPLSTREFAEYSISCSKLFDLLRMKTLKVDDAEKACFDLIRSVCPTFTLEEVKELSIEGLHRILTFIIKTVAGESVESMEFVKKK